MKHEANPLDPMEQLWRAQPARVLEIDMNRIQSEADSLEKTLCNRNRHERLVAWPLSGLFGAMSVWALVQGNLISASGAAIVAVSMLWIVFVLRRFGSPSDPGAELGLESCSFLGSYRRELTRQRRLLSFAWLWYCLPTFVGLALFDLGSSSARGMTLGDWARSPSFAVTSVVFLVIAALNLIAARGLGAQLAELGPMAEED